MTSLLITSRQNPLIKQIRKLQQAGERTRTRRMLLEGTHLLEAALETHWPLDSVLATEEWITRHLDLWANLARHADQLIEVPPDLLADLVTTVTSPGVLAVAPQNTADWQVCLKGTPQRIVLLDRIQDPGNLGTILRTSAAIGVAGVIVSPDSVAPDHPKVLRATSGQWFRQPPVVADLHLVIPQLQAQGYRVIGTTPRATVTFWAAALTGPVALLLGSEGQGLGPELLDRCDQLIQIPQQAQVESLNLGVSAALLLYECCRQALGTGADHR